MSDNTDDMNDLVLLAMARDEAVSKVKELEAKLAKAVDALAQLATDEHPQGWIAIATLVDLKGQDDE